tara:strand:- start:960 stop:1355 length:396 start_codon:yes stop_codon:yes gene_type:complete
MYDKGALPNLNKGYKSESVKTERSNLMNDNPIAKDASGGRSWMSKHSQSRMGGSPLANTKEELDKMKKDKNEKLENKARGVSEEVAKRRKAMETLAPKMHHEGSPNKMHDGKKFEDEGFMDSHFKSGKPRK